MQIFVGLGNPGGKYARNRHNIGFMALDQIASDHGFGPWKAKFQGQIAEGRLGADKVLLLKPETFMNRSGQSVGEAMRFYKLAPGDVTVFHDELDLAPGKCRVKLGGGHAGHNGLRSIHGHIGEAYQRVRMGIGHPGRKELVAGYVLHDFPKADEVWLDDLLRGIADGAPALAGGDPAKFQNAVALRVNPPRSGGGPQAKPAQNKQAKPATHSKQAKPALQNAQAQPAQNKPVQAQPAPLDQGQTPEAESRSPMQRLMDKFR